MTTPHPRHQEHDMATTDPRTDLAGYLGLTEQQARCCRADARRYPESTYGKLGARLIEQDQARDAEPDDGLIPVTVRLTAEEVRARAGVDPNTSLYGNYPLHHALRKLDEACADIDLPAPWKSPLDDRSSYIPGLICDVVRAIWADLGDQREVIRESVERHLNERAMLLRRKPFDSVADQTWVDLLFWIQEADRG